MPTVESRKVVRPYGIKLRLSWPQRRLLQRIVRGKQKRPQSGYQWRSLRALLKKGLVERISERAVQLSYKATVVGKKALKLLESAA